MQKISARQQHIFSCFDYSLLRSVALIATFFPVFTFESGSLERTDGEDWQFNCGQRQIVKHISARIINGTEAPPEHWPWMVAIYNPNDTLVCGGSLINEQYVLTAAHCFRNQDPHKFSVRLGTTLRTNFSQCNNTPHDTKIHEKTARKKGTISRSR
uniref:Putative trypsin-like serine protease n=1 Tax=Ixodes ricinus TaxID=34613 RepID=A0A6B0UVZ6_IXORI